MNKSVAYLEMQIISWDALDVIHSFCTASTTSSTNSSLIPQPHVLLLHHTVSSIFDHPHMVLSPSIFLPVYLTQPLSTLKLSSVPFLPQSRFFSCVALLELPRPSTKCCRLPSALPCAQCRKQLGLDWVLHVHIVGLEGREDKTNNPLGPSYLGGSSTRTWARSLETTSQPTPHSW